MARLVLVSGAWHGAWCWQFVIAALERCGHRAVAVELPGTGADRTPIGGLTMHDWVQAVKDAIAADPEPAVLVGHSRGGAVVSQTAEMVPDRIALAIYVTALMPIDGEAAMDVASLMPASTGIVDEFLPTDDGLALRPPVPLLARAYRNASALLRADAMSRVTPEPLFGLNTPLSLTDDGFGRVPRAYVECLSDEVVVPEQQRAMRARQACRIVRSIDTDHCPTYSAPELLAGTLDQVIAAALD